MDNFELMIENDRLGNIIARSIEQDEKNVNGKDYDQWTFPENIEAMVATYGLDLIRRSVENGDALDVTYNTLENLSGALTMCIDNGIGRGFNISQCANIMAKNFAAYLYMLAMNEHDCGWNIGIRQDAKLNFNSVLPTYWGDVVTVTFGNKFPQNMLVTVTNAVKVINKKGSNTIEMNFRPIIQAYEIVTSIDLSKKGLCQNWSYKA